MRIARITDGTPTYLYTNYLGTPIIGANAAGAVEWTETSTPYGEAWSMNAPMIEMLFSTHPPQLHDGGRRYLNCIVSNRGRAAPICLRTTAPFLF